MLFAYCYVLFKTFRIFFHIGNISRHSRWILVYFWLEKRRNFWVIPLVGKMCWDSLRTVPVWGRSFFRWPLAKTCTSIWTSTSVKPTAAKSVLESSSTGALDVGMHVHQEYMRSCTLSQLPPHKFPPPRKFGLVYRKKKGCITYYLLRDCICYNGTTYLGLIMIEKFQNLDFFSPSSMRRHLSYVYEVLSKFVNCFTPYTITIDYIGIQTIKYLIHQPIH